MILKITLSIVLFNVSTNVYATHETNIAAETITTYHEDTLEKTNDLPFALVEIKSGVSADSVIHVKRTSDNELFKGRRFYFIIGKTSNLSHNFVHRVVPSLGITKIIFPFHSFP